MSKYDEPWTIYEQPSVSHINDRLGSVVAEVWDDECARLIAAAPELRAMVERLAARVRKEVFAMALGVVSGSEAERMALADPDVVAACALLERLDEGTP